MNLLQVLAAFVLPLLLGLGGTALLFPRRTHSFGIFYFVSIGVGIGISSVIFFLSVITQMPIVAELGIEIILVLPLGYLLWKNSGRERTTAEYRGQSRRNLPSVLAVIIVCVAFINASMYFFAKSDKKPNGGGDAYHIWNLKARFLAAEKGGEWKGMFSKTMRYSNPDYPLLLPGFVARNWKLAGDTLTSIPVITQFLFAAAAAGLLFFALLNFTTVMQASLGTLFLLSTPFYWDSAANQFADVAVAFFFLATIVLLTRALSEESQNDHRGFTLAGATIGMAMWTKNEGILFFIAILLFLTVSAWRTGQFIEMKKRLRSLMLGVLPFILLLIYFKAALAPVNELITSSGASTFQKLTDPSRYKTVVVGFWQIIPSYGHWIILPIPLGLIYLAVIGLDYKRYRDLVSGVLLVILPILFGGYVFIYLNTYLDVADHLYNSFDRLLLQLTPMVTFIFFLIARTPEAYLELCKKEDAIKGDSALPSHGDRAESGLPKN